MKKHILKLQLCLFLLVVLQYEIKAQTNLALGAPVVVSSTETSLTGGSMAVDGDLLTRWSSGTTSFKQNLYVDLGRTFKITKVIIKYADGYYSNSYNIKASAQPSTDPNAWPTLLYATPGEQNSPRTQDVVTVSGFGRYVMFDGRGRGAYAGSGSRYRIAEFEVYGEEAVPTTPSQQLSIDEITTRLINRNIATMVDEATVNTLSTTMQADGSWADVNYTSGNSNLPADKHLLNLIKMAVAFKKPGNTYYQSASLLNKITLGIEYYKNIHPTSTNWFYNDIGGPQDYMIPLILIKGAIPESQLQTYSSYLKEQTTKFTGGGRNLTWIAEISLYKGCIENSYYVVDKAFKATYSTLNIVSVDGDEGVKIDYSYHQHHQQLYSGGYGMSLITDIANTIELADGTEFINSITTENRQILSDLLLKGHQLFGYRNMVDFGTTGRNISREVPGNYNNISATVLAKIKVIDSGKESAYTEWANHLSGAPFPETYRGNKYFWKSNIMTQHGSNYYLSAKVISNRTYGTESLNGENLKGFNLPMGATNIFTNGGELNGIFPVWDWSRIPGTTAENSQAATAIPSDTYVIGTNEFGGGVSNGISGVEAYEHNYNGVNANKSYFFMGEAMLCLGSGITASKSNPILTSLNQSLLSGDITVHNSTGNQTFAATTQAYTDVQWVHHDNVGYVFPLSENVIVQKMTQSGSWNDINSTGSSAIVQKDVFSLWVDHGNAPSNGTYQYIVIPDKDLSTFQTLATNHGFVVVKNDTDIQAVKNTLSDEYAVVFHTPGTVDFGNGLIVTSDKKAIVLLKKENGSYSISVSDPIYNQTAVNIIVSKQLSGSGASYIAGNTTIAVNFPIGDMKGSTVSNNYTDSTLSVPLINFTDKNILFPNPARDTATLSFKQGEFNRVDILDIRGVIVQTTKINSEIDSINLSLIGLKTGNYLIKLSGTNRIVTKKLVKI